MESAMEELIERFKKGELTLEEFRKLSDEFVTLEAEKIAKSFVSSEVDESPAEQRIKRAAQKARL